MYVTFTLIHDTVCMSTYTCTHELLPFSSDLFLGSLLIEDDEAAILFPAVTISPPIPALPSMPFGSSVQKTAYVSHRSAVQAHFGECSLS